MRSSLRTLLVALLVSISISPVFAYRLIYKEQIYPLLHQQLSMYPEDYSENIRWLEMAVRADFANPLYAIAVISNEREWELYRNLFGMHLNLHMVNQYLGWAAGYTKFDARFFNYPWKDQNLESLERAESLFGIARYYWDEARVWSAEASQFRWLHLEQIQYWEDQSYRIQTGELDYGAIIDRHLERLERVRAEFQRMDDTTY